MGRRDRIVSHHPVCVAFHLPNEAQVPQMGHQGCRSQNLHSLSWDQRWATEGLFADYGELLGHNGQTECEQCHLPFFRAHLNAAA